MTETTTIRVRYFASLREALGCSSEPAELPTGGTLADLRNQLILRGGVHAAKLSRDQAVRVAVNQVLNEDESVVLEGGAEVAFFPPVTGG